MACCEDKMTDEVKCLSDENMVGINKGLPSLLYETINHRFTNAQGNASYYTIIKDIEKNNL